MKKHSSGQFWWQKHNKKFGKENFKKRIIRTKNEKDWNKKSIKTISKIKEQWKMRKQIKIKKIEINYKRNWKQQKIAKQKN